MTWWKRWGGSCGDCRCCDRGKKGNSMHVKSTTTLREWTRNPCRVRNAKSALPAMVWAATVIFLDEQLTIVTYSPILHLFSPILTIFTYHYTHLQTIISISYRIRSRPGKHVHLFCMSIPNVVRLVDRPLTLGCVIPTRPTCYSTVSITFHTCTLNIVKETYGSAPVFKSRCT